MNLQEVQIMKRMWIELKNGSDKKSLMDQLGDIGKIEEDSRNPQRIILTFENQSEDGIRMAGFRLSEDFIQDFDDFDMVSEMG